MLEPKQVFRVTILLKESELNQLKTNLIRVVANELRENVFGRKAVPDDLRMEWKEHQSYYEGATAQRSRMYCQVLVKENLLSPAPLRTHSIRSAKTFIDDGACHSVYRQSFFEDRLNSSKLLQPRPDSLRLETKFSHQHRLTSLEDHSHLNLKQANSHPLLELKSSEMIQVAATPRNIQHESNKERIQEKLPDPIKRFEPVLSRDRPIEMNKEKRHLRGESVNNSDTRYSKLNEVSQTRSTNSGLKDQG